MASYGNTHSEPAKMEQIITELFAKSLHIILESRCPYVSSRNYSGDQMISSPSSSSSSSSSVRPRDKWFNLALRDCPAAMEKIDFWRQSNLEPMVVDVILVQRPNHPVNCSPKGVLVRDLSSKERFASFWNSEHDEFGCEGKSEKIIERWVVQYETRKNSRDCSSGSKRSSCTSSHTLYKKSILLLRSLYVTVRLLPAYKLFRDLNSSSQIRTFNLAHRISSFVEPFTCREEAEMQWFVFTPVDTSCGRLCLSVLYRSSLSDVGSEPSSPMSPQFIPDYVGSPMADQLKRFPSLPVPQCSPSSSPFGRSLGLGQTGSTDEKFSFEKDKIEKISRVKISSNSSSSRLSFQDDLDDSEFTGPFVVDDDDLTDPGSRPVGSLVCMLKKAPPLHQDLSNSRNLLQASHPETPSNCIQEPNQTSEEPGIQHDAALSFSSSGFVISKTTTDALEELQGYREMKDLLVRQGGRGHK
uniref:Putative Autophagy-related protein 13 n=1 Tax=Davidia involucrata TaxID=16924 RepID=A0A5B6ZQR4_DAVIN